MYRLIPPAALLIAAILAIPPASRAEGTACIAEPTVQPIAYGDLILCSIQPIGDADEYRFLSNGNERILVRSARTGGTSSFEPCIDLIAPSGSTVTACAYNTNYFPIQATLSESGLYTIRVRDFGNNSSGEYMLLLSRLLPDPTNAPLVSSGQTLSDRIDPPGDADLFTFDGVAGSTIAVTATRTGGTSAFEPCVYLWAPDSSLWYSCLYNTSTHTVQLTLPMSGAYTVGIVDFGANSPGDYTVTLGCLGGPCAAAQATTTVPADAPWVDSGVDVSAGQLVALRATANWQATPAGLTGPMGRAGECVGCPVNANRGALLARIGTHPPFIVGDAFGFPVDASWSGRLMYQINDDDFGDNAGSASVHAVYSAPPLGVEPPAGIRVGPSLSPASPNPFVERTGLRLTLPGPSRVSVQVIDASGRVVRSLLHATPLEAGVHDIEWDGCGADGARQPPGVYFYSLRSGGHEATRRAILLQ